MTNYHCCISELLVHTDIQSFINTICLITCLARSVYCIFSSSFRFAHKSPRIRVTLRLSRFGFFSRTIERCLLQKIRKAFIGRLTSFLSGSAGSIPVKTVIQFNEEKIINVHISTWLYGACS